MCLAVPRTLFELHDAGGGVADLDGTRYGVDLTLIEEPRLGDFLIVHAGYAIERLDREEAEARLELFDEWGRSYRESGGKS